jgi:hypothetical protein
MGREIMLFDGKTLNGWQRADGKPEIIGWEVAEGAIHRASRATDIVTTAEYLHFELSFAFKVAPQANSGIKYRFGQYSRQRIGLEYQILGEAPVKPGKHDTASLYDLLPPSERHRPKPAGEWNTGKIVAKGDRIEHHLNGKKVVAVTLGSPEWVAALQASKFKGAADFGTKPGAILLQEHGGEVWLKDLKLKPL